VGGDCWAGALPSKSKFGKQILYAQYQTLRVLYTSAKISYCNQPFTSTLEFWEIELKTLNIFDQIERPKIIRSCNLSWKM